jgi:hypothetical protein
MRSYQRYGLPMGVQYWLPCTDWHSLDCFGINTDQTDFLRVTWNGAPFNVYAERLSDIVMNASREQLTGLRSTPYGQLPLILGMSDSNPLFSPDVYLYVD